MTDAQREARVGNYATKKAAAFKCAACGADDGILAVVEKTTGELMTRCEPCLDRRTHEIRPGQWNVMRDRLREIAAGA